MSKKPTIRHYGIVRNGKKVYYNPELYVRQLQDLEGKEFEETISPKFKKPSQGLFAFYWGGIISTCLTDEQFGGWDKDEADAWFCKLFLTRMVQKTMPDGQNIQIPIIRGTSDLSQEEMIEFCLKVEMYLANRGIQLLTPEEYNLTKYRIVKP